MVQSLECKKKTLCTPLECRNKPLCEAFDSIQDLRVMHHDFSFFGVLSHGDKYIFVFVPASSLYSTICNSRLVSWCDVGRGHICDLSCSLCPSRDAASVTRGSSVRLDQFLW